MRAARFLGNRDVVVEPVDVPEVRSGEVLLRVDSCALCGTDRRAWIEGSDVIPGHETSGTVVDVGDAVRGVAYGDRGVVYLVAACGECASCRRESPNACLRKEATYGLSAPGGFAEYLAVRAECFFPIADEISLDAATALLDVFGTTSHAFARAGRPDARSAAIIGCGPIGLGAIAVARWLGIPIVLGVDVSARRLALAARLGAAVVDATACDVVPEGLNEARDGFDVVIEAAGHASTQRTAIEICAPQGVVVVVAHSDEGLELQTSADLISVERTILGSEYFTPSDFPRIHDAVLSGRLDPAPILTDRYPLERIGEACDAFFGGAAGKVLVRP
jgi:threonine 3-dehydrogenase